MTLIIRHILDQAEARLTTDEPNEEWFGVVARSLADRHPDVRIDPRGTIELAWWQFLSSRSELQSILDFYEVSVEAFDKTTKTDLGVAKSRASEFQSAATTAPLKLAIIRKALSKLGFRRKLKSYQLANVSRIASLPAAATFSVPGSGKTTEALAWFACRSSTRDSLLVVAPKNAFGSWEEQLAECIAGPDQFVRLRGGRQIISDLLSLQPRYSIITYQQLVRVVDLIGEHLANHSTLLVLDESHRIKSGKGKATADAVLSLSLFPKAKLIMSGTPMPQSVNDLVPQLTFLYPEVDHTREDPRETIQPLFVRTTKAQLGLPQVRRSRVLIPMSTVQARLYSLMSSEVRRQADQALKIQDRRNMRALGRSVMRLLQAASDPALLAPEIAFAYPEILANVLAEGPSPKVAWACTRARELARQGRKTLIWTSFRTEVELIAARLADLGAVYIHGGVDTGDEDDDDTREGKIKLFHDADDVFVMVANPAAASESISLHKICRNAVYVDRTYNAAHYLQSEDRIHRLGLKADQHPVVEILCHRGTVDESVDRRLTTKVAAMAKVLNDPGLNIQAIDWEPEAATQEDADFFALGLDHGDVQDLLTTLGKSTK